MPFTHDTEFALRHAAALVNTMPSSDDPDALGGIADLQDFVRLWQWSGTIPRDPTELAEVRAIRPRLRRIWDLDEADLIDELNAILRETEAVPQLVNHDGWGWHLHATPQDAPLATRMLVEAAMAMVDLIREGELERMRTCAADDCDGVLIDLSRNRSRRYCDGGCGNRANVAAYRERLKRA